MVFASYDIPREFHLVSKEDDNNDSEHRMVGKSSSSSSNNNGHEQYGNTIEDAVNFIRQAVKGYRCDDYPNCVYCNENGEYFCCRVSFQEGEVKKGESSTSSMRLNYHRCFRRGNLHHGMTDIFAHHHHGFHVKDLQQVLALSGLQRLTLRLKSNVSNENLSNLGNILPTSTSLKILELEGEITPVISSMLHCFLSRTTSLEVLDLSYARFPPPGDEDDGDDNNNGNSFGYVLSSLNDGFRTTQSTLRRLNLAKCGSPRAMESILNGIKENKNQSTLQMINFSRSQYNNNEGTITRVMGALATLLEKEGITLKTIKLDGLVLDEELDDSDRRSLDISLFAKALRTNTSLTHLDISLNYLDAVGIETLMESLKVNNTLQTITMRGLGLAKDEKPARKIPDGFPSENSCLAPLGWQRLFRGLAKTNGLKELDLSGNTVSPDAFTFLAEGLAKNKTLDKLCLRKTFHESNVHGVGDVFQALSASSSNQSSLRVLDLQENNCFDHDMVQQLVRFLTINRTLQELYVDRCYVAQESMLYFAGHISKMYGLKKIGMNLNEIDRTVAETCREELKNNFGIISLRMATKASKDTYLGVTTYEYDDDIRDIYYKQIRFLLKLNRYRKLFNENPIRRSRFLLLKWEKRDLPSLLYCLFMQKSIMVEEISLDY